MTKNIKQEKGKGKNTKYLMKWFDFPDSESTWELLGNIPKFILKVVQVMLLDH